MLGSDRVQRLINNGPPELSTVWACAVISWTSSYTSDEHGINNRRTACPSLADVPTTSS